MLVPQPYFAGINNFWPNSKVKVALDTDKRRIKALVKQLAESITDVALLKKPRFFSFETIQH
jgi:hypothetical protein